MKRTIRWLLLCLPLTFFATGTADTLSLTEMTDAAPALSAEDWRGVAADTAAFEAYLDSQKKRHLFSETRNLDGATLIFFGANWCDRCKTQYTQASRLAESKQVSLIPINIDDNPNGWDANYLKQLAIDHIPFMILVNADGIVTARDIRIWELKQAL